MTDRPICKSTDHLFVPILEVTIPLLRCIHCDAFAYQETVKQLARNRSYPADLVEHAEVKKGLVALPVSPWRRFWLSLRRNLGFT